MIPHGNCDDLRGETRPASRDHGCHRDHGDPHGCRVGVATSLLARKPQGILPYSVQALRRELTSKPCFFAERSVGSAFGGRNPENGRRFAERESRRHNMKVELMPRSRLRLRERTSSAQPRHHPILFSTAISFTGAHIKCRRGRASLLPATLDTEVPWSSRVFLWTAENPLSMSGRLPDSQKVKGPSVTVTFRRDRRILLEKRRGENPMRKQPFQILGSL